jgi:hypothetical protein
MTEGGLDSRKMQEDGYIGSHGVCMLQEVSLALCSSWYSAYQYTANVECVEYTAHIGVNRDEAGEVHLGTTVGGLDLHTWAL